MKGIMIFISILFLIALFFLVVEMIPCDREQGIRAITSLPEYKKEDSE
ncbi:MAG: hypothetical protein K6E73_09645 [Bacteroidales bacterium]|nr:hypothetical protein [Bacteroidales bacterium]